MVRTQDHVQYTNHVNFMMLCPLCNKKLAVYCIPWLDLPQCPSEEKRVLWDDGECLAELLQSQTHDINTVYLYCTSLENITHMNNLSNITVHIVIPI